MAGGWSAAGGAAVLAMTGPRGLVATTVPSSAQSALKRCTNQARSASQARFTCLPAMVTGTSSNRSIWGGRRAGGAGVVGLPAAHDIAGQRQRKRMRRHRNRPCGG
jgi:hypothetical protein